MEGTCDIVTVLVLLAARDGSVGGKFILLAAQRGNAGAGGSIGLR